MDAGRAPERIGEGHGADELRNLRIDGRSTDSTAPGFPVPEGSEALPVPANDGRGADNLGGSTRRSRTNRREIVHSS